MKASTGDSIAGFASRLNAARKLSAVTGAPSSNLIPRLIVNVYVFPCFDMTGNPVAASGESSELAPPTSE